MHTDEDDSRLIMIMRHAKSDWSNETLADFDRPLSRRGKKDAPRMGHLLLSYGVVPDTIISSPARRALQTASRVAEASEYLGRIETPPELYHGSGEAVLNSLRRADPRVRKILLVAHNPAMEEAFDLLVGIQTNVKFPTGAIACFRHNAESWAEIKRGNSTLLWFIIPRLVKAVE